MNEQIKPKVLDASNFNSSMLTKDKLYSNVQINKATFTYSGIKFVKEKDVILAVEETIKRIEENISSKECPDGFDYGLIKALQIIKEQFNGVISNSEQNQQEDEK